MRLAIGQETGNPAPPYNAARDWLDRTMSAVSSAERGRWALWLPVMIGVGIAVYFGLRKEPPLWSGPLVAIVSLVCAMLLRRRIWLQLLMCCLTFVALGFSAAQLRTWSVDAPVIQKKTGPVWIEGRVVAAEIRDAGSRLTLDNLSIGRLAQKRTPARVRIRGAREDAGTFAPGQRIRVLAVLHPPPGPAEPGAFDFSKRAYFEGLGGVGYAVRAPVLAVSAADGGWRVMIAKQRHSLTRAILEALPGTPGAVAAALITGERGAIPEEELSAMWDSGLAHLLAISGLHIGLIGGFIFFAVRLALASCERLVLAFPVKKLAALAAFFGCFFYLLISGSTLPTQRAFLMLSLVLLAVMIDRNAISMNLVAWAAAAILLLAPESLESVSFQMSFAAVIALVAAYEAVSARRFEPMERRTPAMKGARYVGGVLLTTIIATIATAPFAAFHFNRLALLGVIANLIAVPLAALWIMPLALISLVFMPFGLEQWPLAAMGWGIEGVLSVARWVQALPGAATMLPSAPGWALGAVVIGGLWLCVWRSRLRVLGVLPVFVGIFGWSLSASPDIRVTADGKTVGLRTLDGDLVLPFGGRGFTVETWRRRSGLEPEARGPALDDVPGLRCDGLGCIYRSGERVVALDRDAAALEEDCRSADIVISQTPVRKWRCRGSGLVIDRFDLWRNGAHALYLRPDRITVDSVGSDGGVRPWQRYPRSQNR